jgi:hypothetical protein
MIANILESLSLEAHVKDMDGAYDWLSITMEPFNLDYDGHIEIYIDYEDFGTNLTFEVSHELEDEFKLKYPEHCI